MDTVPTLFLMLLCIHSIFIKSVGLRTDVIALPKNNDAHVGSRCPGILSGEVTLQKSGKRHGARRLYDSAHARSKPSAELE
jgi:hypothetical protein